MTQSMIEHYRKKCKRMGRWMAPRFLRNRGVSFEDAYFILFDRTPTIL
jgi:hypothetical protein